MLLALDVPYSSYISFDTWTLDSEEIFLYIKSQGLVANHKQDRLQNGSSGEKSNESTGSRANDSSSVGGGGSCAAAGSRTGLGASSGRSGASLGTSSRGLRAAGSARGSAGSAVGAVGRNDTSPSAASRDNSGSAALGDGSRARGRGRGRGGLGGSLGSGARATGGLALSDGNLLGLQQVCGVALVLGGALGDGREQLGLSLGLASADGDLLGATSAADLGEGLLDARFNAGSNTVEVLSGNKASNSEGNERGLHLE